MIREKVLQSDSERLAKRRGNRGMTEITIDEASFSVPRQRQRQIRRFTVVLPSSGQRQREQSRWFVRQLNWEKEEFECWFPDFESLLPRASSGSRSEISIRLFVLRPSISPQSIENGSAAGQPGLGGWNRDLRDQG